MEQILCYGCRNRNTAAARINVAGYIFLWNACLNLLLTEMFAIAHIRGFNDHGTHLMSVVNPLAMNVTCFIAFSYGRFGTTISATVLARYFKFSGTAVQRL